MSAAAAFTGDQLLAEAQRRERRERQLEAGPGPFAEALSEGRWRRAPHLDLLSRWLQEAATGKRKRIILDMPPRHGKSEMASHWFPAWFLEMFPWLRVILCSYEADFAATWGRKVRNELVQHAPRLSVRIADDSSAASRWDTTRGGGMITAGVRGPITGKGANILLVDDPIKNAEEAESQTIRDAIWEWWQSTAYTRLEPGASVVLIMTRWHEDDLAGRLLAEAEKGGEQWDVLTLPALADNDDPLGRREGEALWPDRYSAEALATIKVAVGSRVFDALYQQRPSAAEGNLFKKSWWRFWKHPEQPHIQGLVDRTIDLPKSFHETILSWDLSFKSEASSDFVAGGVWACSGPRRLLLELFWERADFVATCTALRKQAASPFGKAARAKLIEDKANGPAVLSALRRIVPGMIGVEPKGGKLARASATSPLVEAGDVFLPLHAPWRDAYIDQHASFPRGKHDDLVDQQSQGLTYLSGRKYETPKDIAPLIEDEQRREEREVSRSRKGNWDDGAEDPLW